jgi:hypothetical protein
MGVRVGGLFAIVTLPLLLASGVSPLSDVPPLRAPQLHWARLLSRHMIKKDEGYGGLS